jgi:hypothetical protein
MKFTGWVWISLILLFSCKGITSPRQIPQDGLSYIVHKQTYATLTDCCKGQVNQTIDLEVKLKLKARQDRFYLLVEDLRVQTSDGEDTISWGMGDPEPFDLGRLLEEGTLTLNQMIVAAYMRIAPKELGFTLLGRRIKFLGNPADLVKLPEGLLLDPGRSNPFELVTEEIKELLGLILFNLDVPVALVCVPLWEVGAFKELRKRGRRCNDKVEGYSVIKASKGVIIRSTRGQWWIYPSGGWGFVESGWCKNEFKVELKGKLFIGSIERRIKLVYEGE